MTRNRFVVLAAVVLAAAFGIGLALGLSGGSSGGGGSARTAARPTSIPSATTSISLPAALAHDCVPTATGARCTPTTAGVDEVLVRTWPEASAMAADFATTHGTKPDGKCGSYTGTPASGLRSTWGHGKPLACYVNSNGAAVVLWEDPATRLELLAVRKDGDTRAAFAWWNEAVKVPLS